MNWARVCSGSAAMYIANTMASAIEALGMSLPYSSSTPAEDALKFDECFRAGAAIGNLLELDLKPREIIDPRGVRKRDGPGDRAWRLDQCCAPPDCDRAIGERAARYRRLSARERPCTASGRLQAKWELRHGRLAASRRSARRDQDAAQRGPAPRRLFNSDRENAPRKLE